MEAARHLPVLFTEVLEYLNCQPGRVYVDGTVGSGGHGRGILERSSPTGKLVGLDWDEAALERARENLAPFGHRVELRKANFRDLKSVLESLSIPGVDGIILDLGLSTEQLEDRERGFSFRGDGPLDMRMSRETAITARDLLETLSAEEIEALLREFGEERWARRIARNIVRRRERSPLRTTQELVEAIETSIPRQPRRIHPATRAFQALRIAVNQELENLKHFLSEAPNLLNSGGRLGIISYHSLEDRLVKNYFRDWAPKGRGSVGAFKILTKKPVVPSLPEVEKNPRARSAKMRFGEKMFEKNEDERIQELRTIDGNS